MERVFHIKLETRDKNAMPGRHADDNLAAKLIDAIDFKVAACVHDDTRNLVAATSAAQVNWGQWPVVCVHCSWRCMMDSTCL